MALSRSIFATAADSISVSLKKQHFSGGAEKDAVRQGRSFWEETGNSEGRQRKQKERRAARAQEKLTACSARERAGRKRAPRTVPTGSVTTGIKHTPHLTATSTQSEEARAWSHRRATWRMADGDPRQEPSANLAHVLVVAGQILLEEFLCAAVVRSTAVTGAYSRILHRPPCISVSTTCEP
jgi:hypothetical protein